MLRARRKILGWVGALATAALGATSPGSALATPSLGGMTEGLEAVPTEAALESPLAAAAAKSLGSFLVIPDPSVAEATAAYRYANMTDAEAYAELDQRSVPYAKADPLAGVSAPVRLTGKLHGVWIHSSLPEKLRANSVYEVLDARLALALDDYAKILERHDIEEVVHYSLYRPNVPKPGHGVTENVTATAARASEQKEAAAAKPLAGVAGASSATPKLLAGAPGASAATPKLLAGAPGASSAAPKLLAGVKKAPSATPKLLTGVKKAPSATPKPLTGVNKTPSAAPKPATGATGVKPGPIAIKRELPQLPARSGTAPQGKKRKASGAKPPSAKSAAPTSAVGAKAATLPKGTASAPSASQGEPARSAKPAVAAAAPTAPAPGAAAAETSKPKPAAPTHTWAPPGTRHPAGLAIDIGLLKKRDGTWLSVSTHFQGKIGAHTCGDLAATPSTERARELRALVCEAYDLGIFTYVLTPNYNAAHQDHFHMEIRSTVKWFLYH